MDYLITLIYCTDRYEAPDDILRQSRWCYYSSAICWQNFETFLFCFVLSLIASKREKELLDVAATSPANILYIAHTDFSGYIATT